MAKEPKFEIPDAMRQMAEKNLEQTRAAYDQMMQATKSAQQMVQQSSEAMSDGFLDMQSTALKYAEESMQASFDYANELVRASDIQQAMKIQQDYAKKQIESYQKQTKDVSKLMTEMTTNAQPAKKK